MFTPIPTGGRYFGEDDENRFAFVGIADPLDIIMINGGTHRDTLFITGISPMTFDLAGNRFFFSNVTITSTYDVSSVENLQTGSGNDRLSRDGTANEIDSGEARTRSRLWRQRHDRAGGDDNDMLYGEVDPADVYQLLLGSETGDDWIFGKLGDNEVDGQLGNDAIDGGPGNDTMTGGAGPDIFVKRPGQSMM